MNKAGLLLLICCIILISLGLLMVFNTTAAEVIDSSLNKNIHQALFKQISFGIIGMIFASIIWFFGYQNIIRLSPILLFFSCVLLALVFVPGIGQEVNGAKRWIGYHHFGFQPSEFAKCILPIYFIHKFVEKKEINSFMEFFKIIWILAIPLLLIFFEPDNGTTAIIVFSFVGLFVLTNISLRYWAIPLLCIMAIGSIVAYQMPHVPDRIRIYLHPELDLKGKGHQPYQAKIAAGSGGLYGKGLGESLQKLNYLPEARSDYIAAIYAEEFGFIGILVLIILYMSMGICGFYIAYQTKDKKGFYLAGFLSFLITFQAFLNLGVVSGLLPSKGTTLPFFSQGGSSLVMNIIAVSLLLNIAYYATEKKWKNERDPNYYQRRRNSRTPSSRATTSLSFKRK